jgi:carbamoyltransferase
VVSQYVLGINPGISMLGSHDPSAVLFEDGSLIYGIEEERLVRQKHATGVFPVRAIQAALDYADIELGDVDTAAVPWSPSLFGRSLPNNLREVTRIPATVTRRLRLLGWSLDHSLGTWLRSSTSVEDRLQEVGTPVPPVEMVGHHKCHAASAFCPSEFDRALVLSIDGRGEQDATTVWYGDEDGLEPVRAYEYPNSWGFLYGAVTEFLGFRAWNGEGKVMGLAPYGEPNADIESTLRDAIDTSVDYDVTDIVRGNVGFTTQRLEELFGRTRRTEKGEFTQWEADLAYTVQSLLEETMTNVIEYYCRSLDVDHVALAGGVALNCKMNRQVMRLNSIERIFVQPVANDAGGAIGAGLLQYDPSQASPMTDVYWGPSYDTEQIVSELQMNKIGYREVDDIARFVAERLADSELVGWFQGRLEMGPRALGNRSILADPRTEASLDRVNKFVKHREGWRPFAPSMLERAAEDYLVEPEPAPYMIKTFDVVPERAEDIPAVLHPADGTTRPQTVRRDQNPRYYRLIEAFEELTGVPVLLNTSFNDNGEPIVTRPAEAIKDFFGMGLDLLVLENIVVEKHTEETASGEAAYVAVEPQ